MVKSPYSAGHFELSIDGHQSTSYLRSVEGGHVNVAVVGEAIGQDNQQIKHGSVRDIEPITIDFGLSGAQDMLKWIQSSWKKDPSYRDGQITHADFNLRATLLTEWQRALILETTFPTLDGSSKEAGYLKVKFLPEEVVTSEGDGHVISNGRASSKQKSWLPSAFRFTIDGVDGLEYTNKLDSFTIKQTVQKHYSGTNQYPELIPHHITFPSLTGTIAEAYAGGLMAWHRKVIKGTAEHQSQKTGAIEFLAPDRRTVLFTITLDGVGISKCNVVQAAANADSIKRVKFELYVASMSLDGTGALGLDGGDFTMATAGNSA